MTRQSLTPSEIETLLEGNDLRQRRLQWIARQGQQAAGLAELLKAESAPTVSDEPPTELPSGQHLEPPPHSGHASGPVTGEHHETAPGWLKTLVDLTADALELVMGELAGAVTTVRIESATCGSLRQLPAHAGRGAFTFSLHPTGDDAVTIFRVGRDLIMPLVTRMLGGRWEKSAIPPRDLTRIESALAIRAVEQIGNALQRCWFGDTGLPWKASRLPHEAACGSIPRDASLVSMMLLVYSGEVHGTIQILAGETAAKVARARLQTPGEGSGQPSPLRLAVSLLEDKLPADQVAQLEAGDVITTELSVDSLLDVTLNGIPLRQGRLGTSNGQKAVRLV